MRFKPAFGFIVALCLMGVGTMPGAWAQTLPRLNVGIVSNQIVQVSWPSPTINFMLQESSSVAATATWQPSALVISSNGGTMSVTFPITNTFRYFRLTGAPVGTAGNYISNGLVAFWKLNDQSGTVGADSSGGGDPLTLVGVPPWGSNYVTLNGTNQYGDAGSNLLSSLDKHDKTVCAWVNKSGNSLKGIVDKGFNIVGLGHGGWGLWVQANGNLFWTVQDNVQFADAGFAGVTTNTWTFVTVVWHYTNLIADFYINGVVNSSVGNGSADEESSSLADLQVGNLRNNLSGGTYAFDGSIREVGIYNRALTAVEVESNFLATEFTTNVPVPNLLYYKMTENAQTNPPILLADSSTHGGTTGTVTTATSLQWVANQAGLPETAVHFNGVSTYLDTGNSNLFNFTTNSFTINLWLLPLTANGCVMANGFFHGNGWFITVGSSYELNFGSDTFGGESALTTISPVSGWPSVYNMVTITRNGTHTPLIYINGDLVQTTGSFTSPASSGESLIMGVKKTGDNYLDGDIWQPQIWNTALSATDVANLYFNQVGGVPWP